MVKDGRGHEARTPKRICSAASHRHTKRGDLDAGGAGLVKDGRGHAARMPKRICSAANHCHTKRELDGVAPLIPLRQR